MRMQQVLAILALFGGASAWAPASKAPIRSLRLRAVEGAEAPVVGKDGFPVAAMDVFVGNLCYGTDEEYLAAIARSVRGPDGGYLDAEILQVIVMRNATTAKERGFGFVKVADAEQARHLADGLDGEEVDGRVLNANVKPSKKGEWVEKPPVDTDTLDDGGLLADLGGLADVFAVQTYGLDFIRNACKKAGIKAGGNLDQCAARVWKLKGLTEAQYKDPALGLVPTRGGRRNAFAGPRGGKAGGRR